MSILVDRIDLRSANFRFWARVCAALLSCGLLLHALLQTLPQLNDPGHVMGWEADWIAHSISSGHGFSFQSMHRWLAERIEDGGYYPTAWIDPLYTYCLAGLISLFGAHYQLAAVLLNSGFLAVAFIVMYLAAEAWISPMAGVLVIATFSCSAHLARAVGEMNNTLLAVALLSTATSVAVRFFIRPNRVRAGALGAVLGVAALGCPSAMLFAPVAPLIVLWARRQDMRAALRQAALICGATVLVVLPWSIRNFVVFQEPVPIRDGAGFLSFVGIVSTAGAVTPELLRTKAAPSWRARSMREAVNRAQGREERRELEQFPLEYAAERDPDGFAHANEAQRDGWLLVQAKQFARAHPASVASGIAPKLNLFVRALGLPGHITLALALLGAILGWRDDRARLITAWVAVFAGPFAIMICYFDRYREPVEPLIVLLAIYAVWRAGSITARRLHSTCSPAQIAAAGC